MNILLSAYACEPGLGSEPGIGWNTAWEIAKYHQVWVLTSNTHRLQIEKELEQNPTKNISFIYFDPWGWTYDWSNPKKMPLLVYLHYYLWQIWAYFIAKPLHKRINFDVVHHVTYGRYSSPSFVSLLSAPFIWGPVGGGEYAPISLWKNYSWQASMYETLRHVWRYLGEIDPFVHLTARRSSLAIAATEQTAERFRILGCQNIKVYAAVGIPQQDIENLTTANSSETQTFRFISTGRLLHWKGFHFGLKAFAQANLPDTEYWIVGDGPELNNLQTLTTELGITNQVKFWGALSREETLSKLSASHVLVHPSLHDSGGWVVLEAMAAGQPVICLDIGGPGIQVTEDTGFKVIAEYPQQAIQYIAQAMSRLVNEPELRLKMGQAARARVSNVYNWEVKGAFFHQIYENIVGN